MSKRRRSSSIGTRPPVVSSHQTGGARSLSAIRHVVPPCGQVRRSVAEPQYLSPPSNHDPLLHQMLDRHPPDLFDVLIRILRHHAPVERDSQQLAVPEMAACPAATLRSALAWVAPACAAACWSSCANSTSFSELHCLAFSSAEKPHFTLCYIALVGQPPLAA